MHTRAGDWKLAGLEYVCAADAQPQAKILPCLEKYSDDVDDCKDADVDEDDANLRCFIIRYDPPERKDQAKARLASPWAADIWGLGCLIWEVIPARCLLELIF